MPAARPKEYHPVRPRPVTLAASAQGGKGEPGKYFVRAKILVVDDEAVVRNFVSACLEEQHEVSTADSAAGGLTALRLRK